MNEGQWLVLENSDIYPSVMQEVYDILLRIPDGLPTEDVDEVERSGSTHASPRSPRGLGSPSRLASRS